jgi:tRNA-Thr(GGU) m(6)t(6)A37 methyltransferase TsaA
VADIRQGLRAGGGTAFIPVGVVRSPFRDPKDIPPPAFAPAGFIARIRGQIVVKPKFAPALQGLDRFSHIIVLFAFHRASAARLKTVPPGQTRPRGVFATRSPRRPNPIGMSVVRLLSMAGNVLEVAGLDMVDGTPVLDIKPYTGRDRKSRIRTPHRGQPMAEAGARRRAASG